MLFWRTADAHTKIRSPESWVHSSSESQMFRCSTDAGPYGNANVVYDHAYVPEFLDFMFSASILDAAWRSPWSEIRLSSFPFTLLFLMELMAGSGIGSISRLCTPGSERCHSMRQEKRNFKTERHWSFGTTFCWLLLMVCCSTAMPIPPDFCLPRRVLFPTGSGRK